MSLPMQIKQVFEKATCLYSQTQVATALDQMAAAISAQLSNENPILLCVMIGGLVPLGNLLPRLEFPLEVDYVHATRYRGEQNAQELQWLVKPKTPLQNRTILVVDDILDGGLTLSAILAYCREQGAKAVYSAVLVDKHHVREPGGLVKADFTGLLVDDHYVFGFGMDYKEYLRNAPGVYCIAEEYKDKK